MMGDWNRYTAGETLLEQRIVPTAHGAGVAISTVGREGSDPEIEVRRYEGVDGEALPEAAAWRLPVSSALWMGDALRDVVRNALARENVWTDHVADRDVILAQQTAPASVDGSRFVAVEARLPSGNSAGQSVVEVQRWERTEAGAFPDGVGVTSPIRWLALAGALIGCFFVGFDAQPIDSPPAAAPNGT
jgi:hypothetical protein